MKKDYYTVEGLENFRSLGFDAALVAANGDVSKVIYPKSATDLNFRYRAPSNTFEDGYGGAYKSNLKPLPDKSRVKQWFDFD